MILCPLVFMLLLGSLGISNAQTPGPATDPPATDAAATDPQATDAAATDPPATDAAATDPPATDAAATDPPATDAAATDPPATDAAATDPPATDAPATDPPATDAPPTDAPGTGAPPTDAPATDPPATDAAATDPPATDAPPTDAPGTDAPPTDAPITDAPAVTSPPPDSLSVECTNQKITVFLDHTKHSDLDFDKITLLDPSCTLADYGDSNATHLWINVPFDSCSTNHSTEAGTITYQNSILSETRAAAGSILISREFQAEFPFKCSYPRSAVVSVASFSPREKVVYTKTAEFGNFTFTMDMYKTDQYKETFDSYPVRVDLNDPLYLEVKVSSNDSQLVLIALRCWGTPSPDKGSGRYYEFIDDGCKNTQDPTLVYNYDENSNFQRPQIGAFRFLREAPDSPVYLHCDVEACRKGDSESRCAKGCQSARKRRGLVLDTGVAQQSVSIGPIAFEEPGVAQGSGEESASSLTIFAAVAGVLGVVVLALIVALVMLFKRYRSPQNAARVVYTKASRDDGKLLV